MHPSAGQSRNSNDAQPPNQASIDSLLPAVYDELREMALDDELIAADDQPGALLELNEAIERLARVEPRLVGVVDCRFFGGLSDGETVEALDVTRRTVQRDWAKARLLLRRALET